MISVYTYPEILYLYNLDTMLVRRVTGSYILSYDGIWILSCKTIYRNAVEELPESVVKEIAEKANSDALLHQILSPYKKQLLGMAINIKEREIDLQELCKNSTGYAAKEDRPLVIFDKNALSLDLFFTQDVRLFIQEEKTLFVSQKTELYSEDTVVDVFLLWNKQPYKMTCLCKQHIFYIQKIYPIETMWQHNLFISGASSWKIAEQTKNTNTQIRSLFSMV